MGMDNYKHRVWLEIDLNVLKDNFQRIQSTVSPAGVIAVLKANAYGLGVSEIAKSLEETDVAGFAVAELNEALQLNTIGKPVQIIGDVLPHEIPEAVNAGIILPITSLETAKAISESSVSQDTQTECHFLVDTGMGRLGILYDKAEETIIECMKLPNLNCRGIYSHFPVAYQGGSEFTSIQVEKFLKLLDDLQKQNITFDMVHIANSDAVNNFPFTYKPPFNYVRTGINLHGSFDSEGHRALKLKSILTLKTRLVAIRTLPAGTTIGYGCTYKLMQDTKVGVISAGYADGLPLALSNRGYVLINGQFCPILGRISMDYTTVSLENIPEAKIDDEVICLGGEGINAITVDYWAQLKNTNPYEIICSFGSRVERRYIR